MKFYLDNSHILVDLLTNKERKAIFIIDTGSPISFSLKNDISRVYINDVIFPINYNSSETFSNNIEELVNEDVSGLIGMDILNNTGLTIDYLNNELHFESRDGHIFCFLNDYNGLKSTKENVVINKKILKNVVFDTGAPISYVSKEYLNDKDKANTEYHDSNPLIGVIDGYLYKARIDKVTLGSGDYGHDVTVGSIPDSLLKFGFDAILNPYLIVENENKLAPNKIVSFDFKHNLIHIK